jgi:hypothetical protein
VTDPREDVYPRRFESRRTGRSGYAPACANEWVRRVCEKPRVKCAPLSAEAPVRATLGRRLGSHFLTEAMERRPELGFDS